MRLQRQKIHGLLTAVMLDSRNVFLTDDRGIIPVINMPPSDIPLILKLPFFITFSFSGSCQPVSQIILLTYVYFPYSNPMDLYLNSLDVLIRFHPTGK
jgi:hypothetical protein